MTSKSSSRTIPKVTAFVTRKNELLGRHELLVFRYPDAGSQFPAGSVEPEEEFGAAALREVAEETGLLDTRLVSHLGTSITELDEVRALGQRAVLRKGPSDETESLVTLPRGYWLRIQGAQDEYVEVRYEELNYNVYPPQVIVQFTGWVIAESLTNRMERGFFHIETLAATPERWLQRAEDRFDFDCYWIPLIPKPDIRSPQQEWLDDHYEALIQSL